MPNNVWTINASTNPPGSTDLVGCHITTNAAGTAYEFTEPNIHDVLSTTSGSSLPTGQFTFPPFNYDGVNNWSITVTSLVTNPASGTWSVPASELEGTPAESGTWTAQAGGGADDDEPQRASSTYA